MSRKSHKRHHADDERQVQDQTSSFSLGDVLKKVSQLDSVHGKNNKIPVTKQDRPAKKAKQDGAGDKPEKKANGGSAANGKGPGKNDKVGAKNGKGASKNDKKPEKSKGPQEKGPENDKGAPVKNDKGKPNNQKTQKGGKGASIPESTPKSTQKGGKKASIPESAPSETESGALAGQEGTATQESAAPTSKLSSSLKQHLSGARFRMLNEMMYTTTGEEAYERMKGATFDEYHSAFSVSAENWPVQPVNVIMDKIEMRDAPGTSIADFGCGEAAIAKTLIPRGYRVFSYDLKTDGTYVVEAVCSHVPLPGDEAAVIDIVVCCLSLMGTDWLDIVREARRIVRKGGRLIIAEVSSRFTDVEKFISLVAECGFKLEKKDASNTHFIMMDFIAKRECRFKGDAIVAADGVLKPCEYKRR